MRHAALAAVLAPVLALAPFAAGAQSYRCVGADGKKYYGQSVPPQCTGQPVEQLNAQGMVVKRIDAAASASDRARKDAEDAERRKREAASKEEGRRDRALLATYTSEKDIEDTRSRALKGNQDAVKEIEAKVAALRQKRAAPGADVKNIDIELRAQEGLLAAKTKEGEQINHRYDEDRKRYVELTKRK